MSYNLVINGSNVVNALKNTYRYDFINGTFEIAEGSEIMITSLQIPYSWFNITARNNNNAFNFYWPSTVVQRLTITDGGSGYQTAPTVQIVGANTTQATATCTISGPVSSFTVTAGGSGYGTSSSTAVIFSGGGGSGATATAIITAGALTGITLTNPGSGYSSPPTVTIGTDVLSVTITAGGSGYISAPTVTFSGGGGITQATGTANIVGGVVTSITLTSTGSGYTSVPTVTFTPTNGGTGATATPTLRGSGATATSVINGSVNSLTLTSGGTGYTVIPTVTFTGTNITVAKASASIYRLFNVSLPDGFYTTTSLNAFIQSFCVTNGFYLIENSTQNYIYYINVLFNPTYYANQIILKTIPTTLPAGYTAPSNWAGYPGLAVTPYVEILSTNHFGKFLGFTEGNYGINSTVSYSGNSNQTPVGSTVNSLIIRCSLVNNNVSSQTDVVDAFAINGDFGRNLNFNNNIEKWIKLNAGRYSSFTVSIVDQNMNDIQILDSNILINFIVRTKK